MALTIHELYRNRPEVQQALENCMAAIYRFTGEGGEVYCDRGTYMLSVNVKVNRLVEIAPEFTVEDRWQNALYDLLQERFWNFELSEAHDRDTSKEVVKTETYHFPEVWQYGRSGGHLCFQNDGGWVHQSAIDIIKLADRHYHLSVSEALENELVGDIYRQAGDPPAVREQTEADIVEVATEIVENLDYLREFFDDATRWVAFVKKTMSHLLDAYEGKIGWFLDETANNGAYRYFDIAHCTAVIDGEKITISWPQHARTWEDNGTWEECRPEDKGAEPEFEWSEETKKSVATGKFRRWVPSTEKDVYSFNMTYQEFVEAIAPEIVEASHALASIASKFDKKGKKKP